MCAKFNRIIENDLDAPVPPCVMEGLTFLFPSKGDTDKDALPEVVVNGERQRKRNKIEVSININKNY